MNDEWKSAADWNAWVAQLAEWNPLGYTAAESAGSWAHPWRVSPVWNGIAERWECKIEPGFCNGTDVMAQTERDGETVEAPLTDAPSVVLSGWRSIGGSGNVVFGESGEVVPEFFQKLGVRGAEVITADVLETGRVVDITAERLRGLDPGAAPLELPERLLRAVDIVVQMTRPRAVVDWQFGVAGVTATTAQFSVGISGTVAARAKLRVIPRLVTVGAADDLTILSGLVADTGFDQVKVATVYLLSPPDLGEGAAVGPEWVPYVRHDLFWNLSYEHSGAVPSARAQNIELNTAGLGGAAVNLQVTVNQLLANNNDAAAAALAFLTASVGSGVFYTAGGKRPKTETLDPPFPFAGVPFKG